MRTLLSLWLLACIVVSAQRAPTSTDLTGQPFFIKATWVVGGSGNWDYLTMDPVARQLFIAHGQSVQVVDVATGTLAGAVTGLREAHSIVLDPSGEFGYVTDGPADQVRVFDRRSMQIVASIPTGPAPRALVLEPQTGLLFVIGAQPNPERLAGTQARANSSATSPASSRRPSPSASPLRAASARQSLSTITVIDVEARKELAEIVTSGNLGFANTDGNGEIYIAVSDRNQIARFDAQAINSALRALAGPDATTQPSTSARSAAKGPLLDWTSNAQPAPPPDVRPRLFSLGQGCQEPRAFAVDSAHTRLFAACTNMKLMVLNGGTGELVARLPIGSGVDAVAYDAGRGLIFSANGGGDGSLTIIRQDVTDTYNVVQTLPTQQRARTLAIDPTRGELYLVTVLSGAALSRPPTGGIGSLKVAPVDGSFQVLVVGN